MNLLVALKVATLRATPTNSSKFDPLHLEMRVPRPDFIPHLSLHSKSPTKPSFQPPYISLTYILYITSNYQFQHFIAKPCYFKLVLLEWIFVNNIFVWLNIGEIIFSDSLQLLFFGLLVFEWLYI